MVGQEMNGVAKAAYQAPTLAIYGGFAELTAAGSISKFLEGDNQGPNAKATRRPRI